MKDSKSKPESKTKIIATIGPATQSEDNLAQLFEAGVDACRLNFSHGDHLGHLEVIKRIRFLNKKLGKNVAILADLQGPKIRLGDFEKGQIELNQGDEVFVTDQECISCDDKLYISYKGLAQDIRPRDTILIDDGKIKLVVMSVEGDHLVRTKVVHGGVARPRKGVNLPDTRISMPSLTAKDKKDIEFAIEHEVDWIALSFVRWASDIIAVKKLLREGKSKAKVIAKIEKPEAMHEIEQIIEETDAVMVARGDLGVEIPFEHVPLLQKKIIRNCILQSKPVIIATQMLESMLESFRPTRAEASDVANAVFDGADTLMLSGETSVGSYATESIRTMQRIIDYAEGTEYLLGHDHVPSSNSTTYLPDSVCYNACKMANQSGAEAIAVYTTTGSTVFKLASNRPNARIYAFTSNKALLPQLSLVWGVTPLFIDRDRDISDAFEYSVKTLKHQSFLQNGDIVVHVAGDPSFDADEASIIKISYV